MTSLVLELQKEIINKDTPLPDLLRKGLVIARKLKLNEFEKWIRNELWGYIDDVPIPNYRIVNGEVKGFNDIQNRWIPVIFIGESDFAERVSKRPVSSSVAELENILFKENHGITYIPFPKITEQMIMKAAKMDTPPVLITSDSQIVRILDTIKSMLLEWTLKLEEEGIIGENMTFTNEEIKKASDIIYNINFHSGVSNSQFNIESSDNLQEN